MFSPSTWKRALTTSIHTEWSTDRTGLIPAERPGRAALWIVPLAAAVFCLGLGRSALSSLRLLFSYDEKDAGQVHFSTINEDDALSLLCETSWAIGVALLACLLMHLLRKRPLPACPHRHISLKTGLLSYFIALSLLTLPWINLAYKWFGVPYAYQSTVAFGSLAELASFLWTTTAGLVEEPLALGLVAVGLRRCRVPWVVIALVAAALRISYHLYYGWAAIAMSLWPILFVYLYRRTGSIMPMILAHGTYNVMIQIDQYLYYTDVYSIATPILIGLGVLALVSQLTITTIRTYKTINSQTGTISNPA